MKFKKLFTVLVMVLAFVLVSITYFQVTRATSRLATSATTLPIVDNFEEGLPPELETWGDLTTNVVLTTVTVSEVDALALPNQAGDNTILAISYQSASYGGFTHDNSANPQKSQNWFPYHSISFWLKGTGSDGTIQVEVFDNRDPASGDGTGAEFDSAERWYYHITDNFTDWQFFTIPFIEFQRRTDWQPNNAPDDGLGLTEVWGYAFGMPAGTPAREVAYLDDVKLVGQPTMIDDFESGLPTTYVWGDFEFNPDSTTFVTLTTTEVISEVGGTLILPGQTMTTSVLQVDYAVDPGAYGGFTRYFEESQDWHNYQGFSFWFKGSEAGSITGNIFDNRSVEGNLPDSNAERFVYTFMDDSTEWQHINIPFSSLVRADQDSWNPDAPNDGLGLTEMWGYDFGFPSGTSGTDFIDNVQLIGSYKIINDFEGGVPSQLFTWSNDGSVTLIDVDVAPDSPLALPGQVTTNKVLSATYSFSQWGGMTNAFVQSENWSEYDGMSFWFYGTNSGNNLRLELKDDGTGEPDAEMFVYYFDDDFEGWKHFSLPWSEFSFRTDYQPTPHNGILDLTTVWGYAIGADGVIEEAYYLDDVAVFGNPISVEEVLVVDFTNATYSVMEGETVTVSLSLNISTTVPVTVTYMTSDGSATVGSDYLTATGLITIAPGDTVASFTVQTLQDTEAEGNETVMLTLSAAQVNIGDNNPATLAIRDDDFLPYQDPDLPVPDRVDDLLARMTLMEKIGQMTQLEKGSLGPDDEFIATYLLGSVLSGGGGAPSSGNTSTDWADMYDHYQSIALSTRLGIPLIYGVDAVHGNSNVYGATIFPHNLGLGATRNPALAYEIGRITAIEVAATGMDWTFAPCVAVVRDERWGRTYESFGETPEVASMMTTMVSGYQGVSLVDRDTVLATAKHYIGDGGTVGGDDQGDTVLSEAELRAIHMPPFIEAIEANVGSIMPSYSSWNGEKMHGQAYLINDVLKTELGFDGFIISDWAAIDQLPGDYNSDVSTAINAGVDMIMVPYDGERFTSALLTEFARGNVSMARIDDAVTRILTKKFELGLFEQPYADRTNLDQVGAQGHRDIARQAVRESLVLLKNEGNLLPLAKDLTTIVVAGKNADDIGNQSGGWTITWQGASGATTPGTTILAGIQQMVPSTTVVSYLAGTAQLPPVADVGIVVVGETPYAEGVGDDEDLALDQADVDTINNVCSAMPCVVVLVSGRPLIISDVMGEADAFVAAWLPGTEGAGVAEVLFGDYGFSGKLPITWPRDTDQLPINAGDESYDPLFPYGFGLEYPGVQFSMPAYNVTEGGTATITVTLNTTITGPIEVSYTTSDGTADSGDYMTASGIITFTPGSGTFVTSHTFSVSTIDDAEMEGQEIVMLTLSSDDIAVGSPAMLSIHDAPVPVSGGNHIYLPLILK